MTWRPEYSVGSVEIDEQHRRLFQIAGDLHFAARDGKGGNFLVSLFGALMAHTWEHFADEERIMLESGYPGYSEHCRQHDDLKRRALDIRTIMAERETAPGFDLMDFVDAWLIPHLRGADQNLGDYLGRNQARPY